MQSSAPGAWGQSPSLPWSTAVTCPAVGNCCATLLIGAGKSWLTSSLEGLVSSNRQQNTHPCSRRTGTSMSPHSHSSSLQTNQRLLNGSQQPLQMAWIGPEGSLCPWPGYCVMENTLPTDSLLNCCCLQFQVPTIQARKVEGNLANIIRTCQVFFSIFIYVQ